MNDKDINFRHLIKTFIPGFFASVFFIMIIDYCIYYSLGREYPWAIISFGMNRPRVFTACLIPAAMFVGILLNTFCFFFLFPVIKKIFYTTINGKSLEQFETNANDMILRHYCRYFGIANEDQFRKNFDIQAFLLHRQDMSNYQHIMTSYYYYLEFQLNSIIVIGIGILAAYLNLFERDIIFGMPADHLAQSWRSTAFSVILVLSVLTCGLFVLAIGKNFSSHKKKEMSYLLGAFHICQNHKRINDNSTQQES